MSLTMSDSITIIPVRTPALGDTSYIVSDAEVAIVVDPQRDLDRFETPINRLGVDVGAILETHVHNDYVSGGPELARRSGARMIVPAAAAPSYQSEPAFHREPLTVGSMTLVPIHTPGHTPEHTSYVLIVEGREVAVFSGGALLAGAAGRSDLLGPARAETLSRLQFRSVNALASLPEDVQLHPTHGQGSFCAAGTGGTTSSTIGQERATNPVLQFPTADAFVADQLSGLPSYPAYYRYMAPINLVGAAAVPGEAPEIDADRLSATLDSVTIVDARGREAFAAGHIPGSLWVGTGDSFSSWVGWLTDIDDPLVLIVDDAAEVRSLQIELARVGYDRVVGWMRGLEGWRMGGGDLSSLKIVTLDEWAANPPAQILDVRDYWERDEMPVANAVGVHLPDIDEDTISEFDRAQPVGVVCASGYRATIAGSILERLGITAAVLTDKGAAELSKLAVARA
jgi:glyoxylase-like metal-dependent hydrolase (beta-lactamase superfamily II)/rhodanese-related sulfurtransferase